MSDIHATGGCLCGGVRFEIYEALPPVIVCHCKQCRRTSGYLLGFTTCKTANLKFLKDETLRWYASSETGRRGFCNTCGSTIFWRREGEDEIDITAGTLDEPTGLKTTQHIYMEFRGDYYEINDGLPQHLLNRPKP